ncbi:TPA: flavodoxin family protein [Legionella pneumophila]|nr:NAD(P)H-dependent oxidoreductase [Legionella pneumophila]
MAKILGVSASLRNARFGAGSELLLDEIKDIQSKEELYVYLNKQSKIRAEDFLEAGKEKGLRFDEIYIELRKLKSDRGLSNSEAALVVALWGAIQEDAEIDHLPLANHFLPTGKIRNPEQLRQKVLEADGIILATPVYFGDRSSLSQSFIEFIHSDPYLRKHVKNKVYSGVAVGAKRNGGQETTLIYQMIDMVNLNMLAVGNDHRTTAQYGGTAVGGDVGTACQDQYGLETCIGAGYRVAAVAKLLESAKKYRLKDKLNIDLWLLQDDRSSTGMGYLKRWIDELSHNHPEVNFRLFDFTQENVTRCIACDICPITQGSKYEYHCIITTEKDIFKKMHMELLSADAVIPCAYSPKNREDINSIYQQFIERSRYLRRDHYAFDNLLTAPFVISEIGANQNLHIRMLTSMIRHHTVLHHPLIGVEHQGNLLNFPELINQGKVLIENTIKLTIGRQFITNNQNTIYNPLGYVISAQQHQESLESGATQKIMEEDRLIQLARKDRIEAEL